MIKMSELRIGNFLLDSDGEMINVASISPKTQDLTKEMYIGYYLKNGRLHEAHESTFSGIGITEDWLFKFGFSNNEEKGIYELNFSILGESGDYKLVGFTTKNGFMACFTSGIFISSRGAHFVHDLQNLYFALTGQELTVKTD